MLAQLLLVAGWPLLVMQSSSDCESDSKPERAASDVKQDVEAILDEWQRREPEMKRSIVRFQRYEYDDVFAVEKRGNGVLHFEPRQKYLWKLKPADVDEGTVSRRETRSGGRFHVTAETAISIYLDRQELILAEPKDKTYSVTHLPPNINLWTWEHLSPSQESQTGFWKSAFAFWGIPSHIDLQASLLAGTNIEQLRETFDWSISETTRDGYISLSARPANARLGTHYKSIDVLLDPDSYHTKGVRIVDPAEAKSTVLVPDDIKINDGVEAVSRPNLRGYTLATATSQDVADDECDAESEDSQALISILAGAMLLGMLIL